MNASNPKKYFLDVT